MEKYSNITSVLDFTATQLFYLMRKAVEQTKKIKDQLKKPRSTQDDFF